MHPTAFLVGAKASCVKKEDGARQRTRIRQVSRVNLKDSLASLLLGRALCLTTEKLGANLV